MKREIKFRAWDAATDTMHEWENIISWKFDTLGWNSFIFLQFTGLLDKNGKEIYEGDIVKCTKGCPHEVKFFMDNGGTYGGGMPGFNLDGLHRNCGKGYCWTGAEEVIGNIYQNPELVKDLFTEPKEI